MLTLAAAIVVAALTICLTIIWRSHIMSASLDNLTAQVAALETSAAAVVTEISSLKAGSDDGALDALSTRIGTVVTDLNAAVAPAAA